MVINRPFPRHATPSYHLPSRAGVAMQQAYNPERIPHHFVDNTPRRRFPEAATGKSRRIIATRAETGPGKP
jgi:hypothetical protein